MDAVGSAVGDAAGDAVADGEPGAGEPGAEELGETPAPPQAAMSTRLMNATNGRRRGISRSFPKRIRPPSGSRCTVRAACAGRHEVGGRAAFNGRSARGLFDEIAIGRQGGAPAGRERRAASGDDHRARVLPAAARGSRLTARIRRGALRVATMNRRPSPRRYQRHADVKAAERPGRARRRSASGPLPASAAMPSMATPSETPFERVRPHRCGGSFQTVTSVRRGVAPREPGLFDVGRPPVTAPVIEAAPVAAPDQRLRSRIGDVRSDRGKGGSGWRTNSND